MKAVLISIQPHWCELISLGDKTLEIRKSRPQLQPPFKCYVYCTKPNTSDVFQILETHSPDGMIYKCNGKVMGEFVCDSIVPIMVFDNGSIQDWNYHDLSRSCLPYDALANYIGNGKTGYGWHISDYFLYDKPKDLSEFVKADDLNRLPLMRPPQSWCYVEQLPNNRPMPRIKRRFGE